MKTHVGHILAELGLRDRIQAVILAYGTGLVRPGTWATVGHGGPRGAAGGHRRPGRAPPDAPARQPPAHGGTSADAAGPAGGGAPGAGTARVGPRGTRAAARVGPAEDRPRPS